MDGRCRADVWQMLEQVVIKVYIYILYRNKARCVAGCLSGSHINRQREGKSRRRVDALCGLCDGERHAAVAAAEAAATAAAAAVAAAAGVVTASAA